MSLEDLGVYISSLAFHSGAHLDLRDNSIVVFVGPNNSGKSLCLKEIAALLRTKNAETRSVASLKLAKIGSADRLLRRMLPYKDPEHDVYYLEGKSYNYKKRNDLLSWWGVGEDLGELSRFFLMHLPTNSRLSDSNPADNFDAIKIKEGEHPIHEMFLDSDVELEISGIFKSYFGSDLVVHRSAGNRIPLYVGDRPSFEGNETATSRSYLNKVEKLELLSDQGDGYRSFASLLLRVRTGTHSIILVDEPEAFLHPPQARAVAELIASDANYEKQVFIATHSNDIIQGILSKYSDRVSIVRLERNGKSSKVTPLSNERIVELWQDPILRYSNSLNGIFHNQVIITESDSDCRFFEAVADSIIQDNKSTFYTYAGGKDRVPVIVKALEGLQVPTRTVVDMDVIATEQTLRRIIESYGFDWSTISSNLVGLKNVIQSRKSWLLGHGFKERVLAVLRDIRDTEIVPKEILQRISIAMKETSPWESVKNGGVSTFPQGDPARNIRKLLSDLKECKVFVVPVGEIERFCPTANSHGPKWVAEVLQRDLRSDPELEQARLFVEELVNFRGGDVAQGNTLPTASLRRIKGRYRDLTIRKSKKFGSFVLRGAQSFFWIGIGSYFLVLGFMALVNWLKST